MTYICGPWLHCCNAACRTSPKRSRDEEEDISPMPSPVLTVCLPICLPHWRLSTDTCEEPRSSALEFEFALLYYTPDWTTGSLYRYGMRLD